MDIIEEGKRVFQIEIAYLSDVMETLDSRFADIVSSISQSDGKLVITGMGKSGHIARKIAATMSSLGTPSFFLHPAEAAHGDLGMVEPNDIIVIISNSGESPEIIKILPNLKLIGVKTIALTSNGDSTLVKYSDFSYILPKVKEVCSYVSTPTSSTTAQLVFGDALAVVLSKIYGFTEKHYGLYHPEGSLGKKLLLKVSDIMRKNEDNAVVLTNTRLPEAISVMCKIPLGIISIVDSDNYLKGVFSDGDMRRLLGNGVDIYNCIVDDVMSVNPYTTDESVLAVEALEFMQQKNITALPVLDNKHKTTGTVLYKDIRNAGIFI